jgi:hypothetical protein
MTGNDYIGFDIHKKTISFCVKAQCNGPRYFPSEFSRYFRVDSSHSMQVMAGSI